MRLPRWTSVLSTLVLMSLGALGGFFGMRWAREGGSLWPLALGALVGGPLNILVHELGHAGVGVWRGLRLSMLSVGPLTWLPEQRALRWSRLPALGLAYLRPPPGLAPDDLAARYRAMILGGPLTGLLFSLACAGLALLSTGPLSTGPLRTALNVTAGLGLLINLLSALPLGGAGLLSDGARWRRLRPGSPTARPEAALLALTALAAQTRPRDWPPELLEQADAPLGHPLFDASARQFMALAAVDRGDLDTAAAELERALELLQGQPPALRAGALAEQAFVLARQGRAPAARAALDALPATPLLPPATRLRAEAAVRLAEGRPAEVAALTARARAGLDDPLCQKALETAWLDELDAAVTAQTTFTYPEGNPE